MSQTLRRMMKHNVSFAVVGVVLGLVCGFKIANGRYRSAQTAELNAAAAQAAANTGGKGGGTANQAEVQAMIEKARSNPNDFDVQLAAAEQFMKIERADGALEFLQQAQKLKPDDPLVLASLAEAHFFSKQYPEAIAHARRSLQQRPEYPYASFYLMASLIETKQGLDEAGKLLRQLEELRPGDKFLAQLRERLNGLRGDTGGSAKTMLQHGPEDPKNSK